MGWCWWCCVCGFVVSQPLWLMTTKPLWLMAREEFWSLAPFIILEAHLKYSLLSIFDISIMAALNFFFNHFLHLFSFFFFTLSCMHHESCLLMQMWPDLIQKAKDGGLDVIQTYVFWNGHEPSPGQVMQTHFLNFIFIFIYTWIQV